MVWAVYLPGDNECVRSKISRADSVRVDVRYIRRCRADVTCRRTGRTGTVRVLCQYAKWVVGPWRQSYALVVPVSRQLCLCHLPQHRQPTISLYDQSFSCLRTSQSRPQHSLYTRHTYCTSRESRNVIRRHKRRSVDSDCIALPKIACEIDCRKCLSFRGGVGQLSWLRRQTFTDTMRVVWGLYGDVMWLSNDAAAPPTHIHAILRYKSASLWQTKLPNRIDRKKLTAVTGRQIDTRQTPSRCVTRHQVSRAR